jgi:predicted ribosome quality control (RQC) complex YloA/Tae2 family protein
MDAILLLAVMSEIERAFSGAVVRGVDAAGPYGLWLDLATPRGPEGVLLSAAAALPRIVPGAPRPPKTRPLPPLAGAARQRLPGTRLAGIVHHGLDRVVRLDFEAAFVGGPEGTPVGSVCRLILEAFGNQPNLVLTDAGGSILEAARHTAPAAARPCVPGSSYVTPRPASRPDPRLLGSVQAVAAALDPLLARGFPPAQALREGLTGISDLYAQEIAARSRSASAADLARTLADVLDAVASGTPEVRLILDDAGEPTAVAPLCLTHLPDARQQPQPTLGDALERLAAHLAGHQGVSAGLGTIRRLLRRIEARLGSRRNKLQAEAEEFARADAYQRMGELLVANQGTLPRGPTEVTLPDHAGAPGARLTIPLDPTLTAGANAERLFRLARRGRRGAARVASRLAETESALREAGTLAARAAEARDENALAGLQHDLRHATHLLTPDDRSTLDSLSAAPAVPAPGRPTPKPSPPRPAAKKRSEGPEPRRFVSSEGLPILVGRDNEGNDFLTLHLARSEDLWLHAEGFPGSHVVVRMQGRTGGVPRQTLVEAAKLAAYYSQARSHGKVAVSYTLKKHVRKPRKSPPGLVTIAHEKSIVVTPDKTLIAKLARGAIDD